MEQHDSIWNYLKCVLKACGGCLLVYLSLINIVHLKCSTTKNLCSKQAGGCFLVYSSSISIVRLMFYYEKCVFKASESLLFSLFIKIKRLTFYYEKCVFKARGGYFLVYSSLTSIVRLICS